MKLFRNFAFLIFTVMLSCSFVSAASLSRNEAENLVNDALQAMDKDPMQAVKNFEQVLAAYPDNGPTYYYTSMLMGSLGEISSLMCRVCK